MDDTAWDLSDSVLAACAAAPRRDTTVWVAHRDWRERRLLAKACFALGMRVRELEAPLEEAGPLPGGTRAPDAALVDPAVLRHDGLGLLRALRRLNPRCRVLLTSDSACAQTSHAGWSRPTGGAVDGMLPDNWRPRDVAQLLRVG